MKRHLSLFLLTLFFCAFSASALTSAQEQVYEAFETEELAFIEFEENEGDQESELEDSSDLGQEQWSGDDENIWRSSSFPYKKDIFDTPLPLYLANLYRIETVIVRKHAQSAKIGFQRPPYFIFYCAFRSDC